MQLVDATFCPASSEAPLLAVLVGVATRESTVSTFGPARCLFCADSILHYEVRLWQAAGNGQWQRAATWPIGNAPVGAYGGLLCTEPAHVPPSSVLTTGASYVAVAWRRDGGLVVSSGPSDALMHAGLSALVGEQALLSLDIQ